MEQTNNPFAGYGSIVKDKSFVGREDEIKRIRNRVLSNEFGNIGIIGLPKIGKSSLVHNALFTSKKELWSERKFLVAWYSMNNSGDPKGFFVRLALDVFDNLKRLDVEENLISFLAESLLELKRVDLSYIELEHYLLTFFGDITSYGIRVILCIDEFDRANEIFQEVHYQLLRTLSYEPGHKVCLVTTSRRNIYDIEHYSGGGSTLFGTFDYLYLGCLIEADVNKLLQLDETIAQTSKEEKQFLFNAAGFHPYLIAMVCYNFINDRAGGKGLSEVVDDSKVAILKYFDDVFHVLDKDALSQKLIRFYSGIQEGISQSEEEYIKRYGLFKQVGKDEFVPFAEFFDEYLRMKWRESPFKEVWPEAERAIREIISKGLSHIYGVDWEAKVSADLPPISHPPQDADIVALLKDNRRKEKKYFGARGSSNLVDQMFPRHYPIFIKLHWETYYKNILGNSENYWIDNLEFIAKVIRNPEQHSRQGLLTSEQMNRATLICQEIIDASQK